MFVTGIVVGAIAMWYGKDWFISTVDGISDWIDSWKTKDGDK